MTSALIWSVRAVAVLYALLGIYLSMAIFQGGKIYWVIFLGGMSVVQAFYAGLNFRWGIGEPNRQEMPLKFRLGLLSALTAMSAMSSQALQPRLVTLVLIYVMIGLATLLLSWSFISKRRSLQRRTL